MERSGRTARSATAAARLGGGNRLDTVAAVCGDLAEAIGSVIDGKPEVIRTALIALLAEGHLLIEDVPGVGKTMLAKTLARALGAEAHRIQFTPDLLPSDVTGVSVFNQDTREFEFKPGSVFAHVVVGDEINRASPKTQSALLECMEERQVSVDGVTYLLEAPFLVIATQNPVEMEGTFPLPEAQRDRFLARVSMGYPSPAAERQMVATHGAASPLDAVTPVTDAAQVRELIDAVRSVFVSDELQDYVVRLVGATREHPLVRLGASPRATLHLVRAARATAALDGRDYVLPDDVISLAQPVLSHRLLLTAEAVVGRRSSDDLVADIVASVPVSVPLSRGPGGRERR